MTRVADRGDIDRTTSIPFSFDGTSLKGLAGDTLASALLANNRSFVGRSFKYHRARGIFAAGVDEPNALVSIGRGADRVPNLQATTVELEGGLIAESQNRFPSLKFDLQSVNQLISPLLGAGFYYKTFMGPTERAWMFYEGLIRRAAGLGTAPAGDANLSFDLVNEHCDVLVVGGGIAGLEAALEAAGSSDRVILAEQDFLLGGQALATPPGSPERYHLDNLRRKAQRYPNLSIRKRTTVFGAFDHGVFGLCQSGPMPGLCVVRTKRCVLATGSQERGIAFPGNDRPGIMLSGAVRKYLNRFGVCCGKRVVIFTTNDSADETAYDLSSIGAQVTLVDPRSHIGSSRAERLKDAGVAVLKASQIVSAMGRRHVKAVRVSGPLGEQDVPCDLLGVSGGWSPILHLACHRGGKLRWDVKRGAFEVDQVSDEMKIVGAASGQGLPREETAKTLWSSGRSPNAFVDLQNDVTVGDISQACDEGFDNVEHLKRYTTLGMGTDQGKTSSLIGAGVLAERTEGTLSELGTTTFRPPYCPVSLGVLAGTDTGERFHMARHSPLAAALEKDGAILVDSGLWKRAWFFQENGETLDKAYIREMEIVRSEAAISDISSLGKIDLMGPDAAELLNRIYTNEWKTLPINKARWGIMLRDDGFVFDDGTTARIGPDHYFMTTTTANAGRVLSYLVCLWQTAWTDLRVQVTSVTDQWAAMVVAGPQSRNILEQVMGDQGIGDEDLPHLGVLAGHIAGHPVRILRMSFSGERSYEIYTPAHFGVDIWFALRKAGAKLYGLEALGALRIEKGHVAANEIDGRTTLNHLGLEKMASKKKPFVGRVLAGREGLLRRDRLQLVGLESLERQPLSTGSLLSFGSFAGLGDGRVTSATWSPTLNKHIALALVKSGRSRQGEGITVHNPARKVTTKALLRDPHFLDPKGERMRG